MPKPQIMPSHLTGEVNTHVEPRKRGSAAASWQGPASGQGTSDTRASIVGAEISPTYEEELGDLQSAYPGAQIWHQEGGFWLLTESSLLPGLSRKAVFLTGISIRKGTVKSWGFWQHGQIAHEWIGPRHTNFPDGSVCAFEPRDRTWLIGYPIVELIDMYSLWAGRHLHLQVFGRWPGPQAVAHPYERTVELRKDELCGCDTYRKRYGECCWEKDHSLNQLALAVNFLAQVDGNREPPAAITNTIRNRTTPPHLDALLEEVGFLPITPGGIGARNPIPREAAHR